MTFCCDSPTCGSCCLKTCSITVTLILMAICLERLILDLLGYQWTGCVFDFVTVISCLFAVASVCQLRPGFCWAVGAWLLSWLGWNAFLVCYYLDVSSLQSRAGDVLHWGTGQASYWHKLLLGCSRYRLQLRLPGNTAPDTASPSNATGDSACLVDYPTAEILQCAAGGCVALLSLLLLACLVCQLREELRKYEYSSVPPAFPLLTAADGTGYASGGSGGKATPGRRMRRRRSRRADAEAASAAAAVAAATLTSSANGGFNDGSLGRRSVGSRRSSVMRDPLPWVELQVTAGPPPPQPQLPLANQQQQQQQQQQRRRQHRRRAQSHGGDSGSSDGGVGSDFVDDARPPPYTASSLAVPQQQRRRHRSAGSSGRKRKAARRRAAGAAAAPPMATGPRPASALGYHDNPAYARDDELGLVPPSRPGPIRAAGSLADFRGFDGGGGVGGGGGMVNRTFTQSSESVTASAVGGAATAGGPSTPYASGAGQLPMFSLQSPPSGHDYRTRQLQHQQPLQLQLPVAQQRSTGNYDDDFPPPPSPMLLAGLPLPPAPAPAQPPPPSNPQQHQRPLHHRPLQQPAESAASSQHRPIRGSGRSLGSGGGGGTGASSRSRAPLSPDAAAFDQFDGEGAPSSASATPSRQQQQQRVSLQRAPAAADLKPIFVSTRGDAAAASAAAAAPSAARQAPSPNPVDFPRQASYRSAASGGVHGGSVLI